MASAVSAEFQRHVSALVVVIDIYPEIIKTMICNRHPPPSIVTLLNCDFGQQLLNQLTPRQQSLINSISADGYTNLDIDVMYKLCRHFGLVKSPTQKWGRKPRFNDINQGDDVERMRHARNDIVHRPRLSLTLKEHEDFFAESIQIAIRLDIGLGEPVNGFRQKIENEKSRTLSYSACNQYLDCCARYQGNMSLNYTRKLNLYFGDDIQFSIDNNDFGEQESTQCIVYVRDNSMNDTSEIVRMLQQAIDRINEGHCNIRLQSIEEGSLIIHLIVNQVWKDINSLFKELLLLFNSIFEFDCVNKNCGRHIDVVLAKSDYNYIKDQSDDIEPDNSKPDFTLTKLLKLNVAVHNSSFKGETTLHSEVHGLLNRISNSVNEGTSNLNISFKDVVMTKNHKETDVPSQPIGPLEISDVNKTKAILSWQPSKNDGGSPITGYIIETRELWKSTYTAAAKVKPNLTTFELTGLKEGENYFIQVKAVNIVGYSKPLESVTSFRAKSPNSDRNMAQEQENFYRHSTVIVDETKESFLRLLDFHLRNQGITLHKFIEINGHKIYHLCYNRYPCCLCEPGTRAETKGSRVLHPPQLEIFLDITGRKLQGHNSRSISAPNCCCPVNPNIQLQDIDFTLARILLVNFTSLVSLGSLERKAIDFLVNSRNESFAHAKEGKIGNSKYQTAMRDIENQLLVLAKVYGMEEETKQRIRDISKQPFNAAICQQLQITLLQQCQLEETIKRFFTEKSIPEYLTKDLEDIKVTEGCDVRLELWTTEADVNVEWFKGDKKIVVTDKFVVESSGQMHTLVVTNADLKDRGIYTAKLLGFERKAKLNIKEYFSINMKNKIQCIEGDSLELSCAVIEDNIKAYWEKDGIIIQQGEKYMIKDEGKSHKLFIRSIDQDDAGEYSVKINDRVRSTSVQVKEYFSDSLGPMTCLEGESVKFECEVMQDNQKAQWFKDGTEVSTSDKYKVDKHGRLHRLIVNNTKPDDQGEYCVKIKNCLRRSKLIVQEIPAPIRHLSEEDKGLYLEIIKSATETRYYIRIMIIGENGVGKTCLLRRLLGETIDNVTSTDGIDVVHRCKIRLSDGQWITDKGTQKRKEILVRIKRALDTKKCGNVVREHIQYGQGSITEQYQKNQNQSDTRKDNRETKDKRKSIKDTLEGTKLSAPKVGDKRQGISDLLSLTEDERSKSVTEAHQFKLVEESIEPNIKKALNQQILNELSQFINDIEKYDIPDDILVECGFWDFAGQKHFYPTHQIFLNPNAVHLLVADIMKDVKKINIEGGYDKIGEYIDFWFDSIHSIGAVESAKDSTDKYMNPSVILVCTGIDKCKDKLNERKNEFRKKLLSILDNEEKQKHLRRICYVSNTEPSSEDFECVRRSIFEFGRNIKTFGEKLPLRWIRLEQALDIVCEAGVNILFWSDMTDLASECSIIDEEELRLFLKYHHKVGNIIYFETLKDYIILNQKWLADAFRCFVSVKFDDDLKLTKEWKKLEDTGELKPSLIVKLFQKEPQREFHKHASLLLQVMEMFSIIFKLATFTEDAQTKWTYYMPCMISENTSIEQIYDVFGVKRDNCTQSPWLCIQLDFMPFDFFNHIFCHYVRNYSVCTEVSSERKALYHGMGVFFHDTTKSTKFIVCFSKNTIGMQIWQWRKLDKGKWKSMLEELTSQIVNVKNKYEPRRILYSVKTKCANGNIQLHAGRYSYKQLKDLRNQEYFCEEHKEMHNITDFLQTWFEEYSENESDQTPIVIEIQDQRFNEKCHICDKEPSVFWCDNCHKSMCKNCNTQHPESADTSDHIVQHVQDTYKLDHKFKVNVVWMRDIKILHDGLLVIADYNTKQLVTCHITGHEQNTIPLSHDSYRICVVDNDNVAVTLFRSSSVVIVDVREKKVVKKIDVKAESRGIMYKDQQLFIGCIDSTIQIINMNGEVTRTIPVGVVPQNICGGDAGRIFYNDHDKVFCIDTAGKALFTLPDHEMREPRGITTDDEGYLLVICNDSHNVLRIDPDGKHSQVIITQIPKSYDWPHICYNSLSKSVVFSRLDFVYVYKKL